MPWLFLRFEFRPLADRRARDFGRDDVRALAGIPPDLLSQFGIATGHDERQCAAERADRHGYRFDRQEPHIAGANTGDDAGLFDDIFSIDKHRKCAC